MYRELQIFAALLLLFVMTARADHPGHRYAYVNYNIKDFFSCVPYQKTSICAGQDIEVIRRESGRLVEGYLRNANKSLENLRTSLADPRCIRAFRSLTCLGIPRCVGDGKITVNSDAALAQCRRGRDNSYCSDELKKAYFDCVKKAKEYKNNSKTFKHSCKIIKDPNGFCPDVKYKKYEDAQFDYAHLFNEVKSHVEIFKDNNNVTEECYQGFKALACSSFLACSDDEKYAVLLYNKDDCRKAIDCLPDSERDRMKSRLCSMAPKADDTSIRKVPYPTGEVDEAPCIKITTFLLVFALFSSYIATLV